MRTATVPVWAALLIAAGAFLAGSILGGTAGFIAGRPAAVANPAGEKRYTREEFRALVVGKTPDEVIAAVGKPDSTQETLGSLTWFYRGRTYDPTNDRIDTSAQLIFERGRVDHVNY